LGTAEFVYNNKVYAATKTSPFKANYSQDPKMGFEGRRKGKYKVAEKFVERIRKIQEEVKAVFRESTRGDEEVCKQKKKGGGRIQSRRLSTTKHEGFEVANERKKIGETDRTLCRPLQSKRNHLE